MTETSVWSPPVGFRNRPVTILGAGVLGRRMACCWLSGGYNVHVRDPAPQQLQDCLAYAKEELHKYPKDATVKPGTLKMFEDLAEAVADAWLVIEAVPEKLPLKISTFAQLEELAPPDAIFTTNSSSYRSSQMLGDLKATTKARILNSHYFMPPGAMAVELMTDGHTHPDVFPFMVERQREAGTKPYVARKESTGFIFNRIWAAVKREVMTVLAEGVSVPEEIDALWAEVLTNGGGPCRMMDNVGLDTVALIEENYIRERKLSPALTVDFLRAQYLDQGKLGNKSPKGGLYPPSTPSSAPAPAAAQQKQKSTIYALDSGLASSYTAGQIIPISPSSSKTTTTTGTHTLSPPLLTNLGIPDGITLDRPTNTLFYTVMGNPALPNGAIHSIRPDGTNHTTIIPSSNTQIHTPKQLVCDPASQKLYIADREGMRVIRCNYDGTSLETLIQTGDWEQSPPTDGLDQKRWCVGIAVSAALGRFYWTQKGASKSGQGRIFSAGIDMPSGQTALTRGDVVCLAQGLPEAIDLEVYDGEKEKVLYWTDRGERPSGNTLNRMKLKGDGLPVEGEREIVARGFHEAIGLSLDAENKCVYVADLGGSVYRCGMEDGTKEVVFADCKRAWTGIVVA